MTTGAPTTPTAIPLAPRADDGLPPRPQPPADKQLRAQKKGGQNKTVAIWVVAMLGAMAAYGTTGSAWLAFGPLGAAVLGYLAWFTRRAARFTPENNRANELFVAGEARAAAAAWEALARAYRSYPGLANLALYNTAIARQMAGEPEVGLAILGGLIADKKSDRPLVQLRAQGFDFDHELAVSLARGFALVGDTDAASRWWSEAEAGAQDGRDPLASRALARLLLRCRQGRYDEVERAWDEHRAQLEAKLNTRQMHAVTALRAFALARGEPADSAGRALTDRLADAPSSAFTAIVARWPEMHRFLAERGIPL